MNRMFLLAGAAIGALASVSGTAVAQTGGSTPPAASENAGEVEEILVTARRIEEDVQDIPVAVTAISGRTLERSNFRAIRDLAGLVPNLNIRQDSSTPSGQVVALRGQAPPEITLTVDPAVALYIDGILLPRSYGLRAGMIDLQRVEALRGPQGTLYGKNTPGGAIGFITKDPGSDFGVSIAAGVGNYGSSNFTGIINLPVSDNAGFRLVLNRAYTDGYGRDGLDRRLAKNDDNFARLKFLGEWGGLTVRAFADLSEGRNTGGIYKIAGLVPATLTAPEGGNFTREAALEMFGASNATTWAQVLPVIKSYIGSDPYQTGGTASTRGRSSARNAGLDLTYEISDDLRVRSLTGYRWMKFTAPLDLDGTPFTGSHPIRSSNDEFFSEELQLLGGDKSFNWVAGIYASTEKGQELGNTQNLARLLMPAGVRNQLTGNISGKSAAIFGQFNWQISPKWAFTAGGRYTTQEQSLVSFNRTAVDDVLVQCNVPVALRADPAVCASRKLSNTFNEPTWTTSLTYFPADDVAIYVKASHGFRSGGQNYRGAGSLVSYQHFQPETVNEYEVGVKSELFDRRLKLNIAAYSNKASDVQRSVIVAIPGTGQTATVITNAAKARVNGFEVESSLRVGDRLTLNGSIGVIAPKYLDFSDFTGDRSNEAWPVPDVTYNLSANYVAPTSAGDLTATLGWSGQSRLNLSPASKNASQVTQRAYGLLSGRLSLDVAKYDTTLSLFGRNLLNKSYNVGAVGLEALGLNTVLVGEPRTWGFEIVKRFGAP